MEQRGSFYVGRVADVRIYRNLTSGRELALDASGCAHDLYAGGYWPVAREDAIRYALGETDRRPEP